MLDLDFIKASQEKVKDLRAYAEKAISSIANVSIMPTDVNFCLLNIFQTGYTSSYLQARLLQKGFLVRNCNTFPGMKEDYLRIAIRDKDIMDNFANALREILEKGDSND
jgi:threonine-phosphate decarboxylase